MRHRVAHRKLGRVTEHRISMLRNQATALLKYEHLTTTVPKAKELRPFVERLITVAKRGLAAGEANGRVLNARRLVMEDLQDREVVTKLFDTIAPRFATVMSRSTNGRSSFARATVVVMCSWRSSAVAWFRSIAMRCSVTRPSFLCATRCLIICYSPGAGGWRLEVRAAPNL